MSEIEKTITDLNIIINILRSDCTDEWNELTIYEVAIKIQANVYLNRQTII